MTPPRTTPPAPTKVKPMSWTMFIPDWHPTKLNQLIGRHFAVVARLKRVDRWHIATWSLRDGVRAAQGKRRVQLTIILGPRQRAADPDAYWKCLLDALVHCGLLKDDNRQWVELAPVEFDRGKQKATIIKLEDIS
jgi:Holliday junction resolvase RusA-like endonuclease